MTRAYLAFTEKGLALAQKLASALPGTVDRCGHGGPGLADWAAEQFAHADALIFVGAVGIAVRAIAPHCRSKAVDPAVVVLDECGHFAVPILSGHLGGANDLARSGRAVALVCSGDAGVYGMASPLLELAEHFPDVTVEVVPGLTAALSGGAVLGAPLAHDFCVLSLSDRLTPWEVIERRRGGRL